MKERGHSTNDNVRQKPPDKQERGYDTNENVSKGLHKKKLIEGLMGAWCPLMIICMLIILVIAIINGRPK